MIFPSLALRSFPRRLLSAVLARSNLASWSRMPSVSSPSGLSSPAVQGTDLCTVLLELPPEEVVVCALAGEAVALLGEHHAAAAAGHQVPHLVHARSLP